MVRKNISTRSKLKPRGLPFPKGNKRGKLKNDVLDAPGHESSDRGEVIDHPPFDGVLTVKEAHLEPSADSSSETVLPSASENEELGQESKEIAVESPKLIDSIEFERGTNKLKITLSKKHNRMYRIQIFLNDTTEIRPQTYTGSSPAMTLWNLLKGSLK